MTLANVRDSRSRLAVRAAFDVMLSRGTAMTQPPKSSQINPGPSTEDLDSDWFAESPVPPASSTAKSESTNTIEVSAVSAPAPSVEANTSPVKLSAPTFLKKEPSPSPVKSNALAQSKEPSPSPVKSSALAQSKEPSPSPVKSSGAATLQRPSAAPGAPRPSTSSATLTRPGLERPGLSAPRVASNGRESARPRAETPQKNATSARDSQAPLRPSLTPSAPVARMSRPPAVIRAAPSAPVKRPSLASKNSANKSEERTSVLPRPDPRPPTHVSRPPRANAASLDVPQSAQLLDEPPDSNSRHTEVTVPARRPAPSAAAVTARVSKATASVTPPPVIEVPVTGSSGEPSAVDIPVDLASSVSGDIPVDLASSVSGDIPVDLASSVSSAGAETRGANGDAEDIPVDVGSMPPPRPLLKRRAVLLGAGVVVIALGVIAFAKGSRPSSVESRRSRVQASSTQLGRPSAASARVVVADERPRSAQPTANPDAPAASVSGDVAATAGPVAPAASASGDVAAEDEVKIAINVKPDGSSLFYKGRVVGKTPFILKQPRGEKRSYEARKPGYAPRRVVITGNERSIGFELGLDTPHPDSL